MKDGKTYRVLAGCIIAAGIFAGGVFWIRGNMQKKEPAVLKNIENEKLVKAGEEAAVRAVYPDLEDLTFTDLDGMVFRHTDIHGPYTELHIKSDGSFEGFYCNENLDRNLQGAAQYKWEQYECSFHGKFTNLTKTGPYAYGMKCSEFQTEGREGEAHVRQDILITTSKPYGFLNADEVRLYLPGKLGKDLPEEFISGQAGNVLEYGVLTSYGLFNVGDGSGYIVQE